MTQPTTALTFLDLYTEVADYLGYGRSPTGDRLTEVKRYANEGVAQFLMGLDPRTERAYTWSFLEPQATLTLWASIAAGTTTVSGSVSSGSTELTATTDAFYPSMIGHDITITDVGTFTVTAYTSATAITVSGDATCSAKTFSMSPDGCYTLGDDFAHVVDDFTFSPTAAAARIEQRSVGFVRAAYAGGGNATGHPACYAVQPRSFTHSIGQRWEVLVHPIPSADFTVYYRYRVNPDEMTNDADYPPGGAAHAQAILACCLAVAEARRNDGQTHHHGRAKQLLAAAIDIDARNKPKTLTSSGARDTERRGTVSYS